MKLSAVVIILVALISNSSFAIAPFFKLADKKAPISEVSAEIIDALTLSNFEVLGTYNVGNQPNMVVVVFTNEALKKIALGYSNRGALAIAQKVGLVYKNGKTTVSLLNPLYMFHAYFQNEFGKKANELNAQADAIKKAFEQKGFTYIEFGGDVRPDDLHEYQYMVGMPEFDDYVNLKTYASFDEGLKTIKKNLDSKGSNAKKVYELVFQNKSVAVFGIGLPDKENGEEHFLSIIGSENLAAMPYEIILQGNQATMLHGRFRFALYWPELSMSTFTKIMSTPSYVEETMQGLTE